MNSSFCIHVIEDDPILRNALQATLSDEFDVCVFDSAESCQQALTESKPQLFLLDIGLPGMDGYTFCKWIKDQIEFQDIPIIFLSAQESIDARLAGYSAGAEDFIVKPFDPVELLEKIKVAQRISHSKESLRTQVQSAEEMTNLVLTSMEESGVVLQFLSKLVGSSSEDDVAEGFLHLLDSYHLRGAIQTRIGDRSYTLSREGVNLPLEISIVNHVRAMDRIFEFKTRSVFNFDKITILVNNMPLSDPDLCGRIRDNLATAAQGADGRLNAIEVEEMNRRGQKSILDALDSINGTLSHLSALRLKDQRISSEIMYELQEELARSFVSLGLTVGQENQMEAVIKRYVARLLDLFDQGEEQQAILKALQSRLLTLSSGASHPTTQ